MTTRASSKSTFALGVLLASLTAACSSGDDAGRPSGPSAERVSSSSQLFGGDCATGRAGDTLLANGRVRAIIQDLTPSRWFLDMKGAALTDLDIVRAQGQPGADFFKQIVPTLAHVSAIPFGASVNVQEPRTLEIVESGGASIPPRVRVVSGTNPFGWIPPFVPQGLDVQVEMTTDYVLEAEVPYVRIETTIRNVGPNLGNSSLPADILMLGDDHREFVPRGGFDFPGYGLNVDYVASVTSSGASLLVFRDGGPFSIVGDVSGFIVLVHPGVPLANGAEAKFVRYVVAGNGDLASVQGPYYGLRGIPTGVLEGTVEEPAGGPGAGVLVSIFVEGSDSGADAQPASTALADSKGKFRADLPPGSYVARVENEGRESQTGVAFAVSEGATTQIAFTAPPTGEIALHVRDESGRAIPARVRVDGPVGRTVLVPRGDETIGLRPGRYTLTASRGFEWTREVQTIDVPAGGRADATFSLSRVVDTTGYVACEFHLHTNKSSDNNTLVKNQVASIAGMGIEYAMATDHDMLTDYAPVIESLGLGAWLKSGVGEEVSTTFYGHFQGYPLTFNPDAGNNGAVSWVGKTPSETFAAIRADPSNKVVQVNHPNSDVLKGYFTAIGYDNVTGRATRKPQALGFPPGTQTLDTSFDAFEAMNGASLENAENAKAFASYASLTNFGGRYAMTGNSDSHSVGAPAGYPRNLVRSSTDDPARVDPDELMASVKHRRLVISGGLFLTMTVDGAEVGSDVTDTDGMVDVGLKLQAPPWMDAKRITLYANGEIVRRIDVPASQEVVRYEGTIPVPISKDTWFLASAQGSASMSPVVGDIPFGVTNPIWVDRDGNGRFDPPGMPATLP